MDSHDHFQDLKKAFQTSAILFLAIITCLILYVGVAELVRTQLRPFVGFARIGNVMVVRYIASAMAVLAIITVRFLQNRLLRQRPGETPRDFIQTMSRAAVVSAVLCEMPGLLGFLLFLLTGSHLEFLVLVFVSFFLAFMYFPRKQVWESRLRDRFPGLSKE